VQFTQEMIDELKRDHLLDHDVLLSDEAANQHLLAYAYLGSIIFNLLSDKPEPVLDEAIANEVQSSVGRAGHDFRGLRGPLNRRPAPPPGGATLLR